MMGQRTIFKDFGRLRKIVSLAIGAVIAIVAIIVLWKDSVDVVTMLN